MLEHLLKLQTSLESSQRDLGRLEESFLSNESKLNQLNDALAAEKQERLSSYYALQSLMTTQADEDPTISQEVNEKSGQSAPKSVEVSVLEEKIKALANEVKSVDDQTKSNFMQTNEQIAKLSSAFFEQKVANMKVGKDDPTDYDKAIANIFNELRSLRSSLQEPSGSPTSDAEKSLIGAGVEMEGHYSEHIESLAENIQWMNKSHFHTLNQICDTVTMVTELEDNYDVDVVAAGQFFNDRIAYLNLN